MGEHLYRIGQLSRMANISARTIDYYTKLGLLNPQTRSDTNYRLYSNQALERLKRIEELKKQKYTLEEIKKAFDQWDKLTSAEQMTDKLTSLQIRMQQLEREAKELSPMIEKMKPSQVKHMMKQLTPHTAACIEALVLLLGKNPFM